MPYNKIEHTVGDTVGSTIDFKKKKISFDNPEQNKAKLFGKRFFKRFISSWVQWIIMLGRHAFFPLIIILFIAMISDFIFLTDISHKISSIYVLAVIKIFFLIPVPLVILQYYGPWQAKLQKVLVQSTGHGKKHKALFTNFTAKEFVLPDFRNILLDFKAEGDVSKQLKKIRIKKGRDIHKFNNCFVKRFVPIDPVPVWNAYFYFENIPQNGCLRLKWI